MQKKKFKVGDRVVVVSAAAASNQKLIGLHGVVVCDPNEAITSFITDDGRTVQFLTRQMELYEIYNSPLYKALL